VLGPLPSSSSKGNLIVELEETKRNLAKKEDSMRQMERWQWLEESQGRKNHERR